MASNSEYEQRRSFEVYEIPLGKGLLDYIESVHQFRSVKNLIGFEEWLRKRDLETFDRNKTIKNK